MKLKHIRLLKKGIFLSILILTAVILQLIKTNTVIAEYFFARGISRAFVFVFGNISNLFPFSLFELFIAITVTLVIIWIIIILKNIKKKKKYNVAKILLNIGVFALIFVNVYTLSAGGNYYREKAKFPSYEGEQLNVEQMVSVVNYYWQDYTEISQSLSYDSYGNSICPYTYEEIYKFINKEYKKLSYKFPKFYNTFQPTPKKMASSFFMSHEGIAGISFLPLGEANVNYQTPQCYLIFTMAHEIAHVKGVMTEREANLLATYALIGSDIPYMRYCGYMYAIGHVADLLQFYDKDIYASLYQTYPENALIEKSNELDFWWSKSSFLSEIGNFFNDLYLKINGASEGVDSYHDHSQIIIPEDSDKLPIIYYSDTAKMLIDMALDNLVE